MTDFADMEQMPLEASAMFTAMTEGMGLTHSNLAKMFKVTGGDPLRAVRRWCLGQKPIPKPVYDAIATMYDRLDDDVDAMQARVEEAQQRGETVTLTAYRNQFELAAAEPDFEGLPASFHRAVLLRVWEATGAPIVYASDDQPAAS